MAVTVKNIIPRGYAIASDTNQYTASNCKTIIDKFTVTNVSAANETLTVNLVALLGTPGAANAVLSLKSVAPGETYTCPELVGQVIEDGGFISTLASDATSLVISATGREIT